MAQPTQHVVFNPSGAASLREAIRDMGRDDEVSALFDVLSFGPLDPAEPSIRSEWIDQHLGISDWHDVTSQSEEFWRNTASAGRRRIVWTSRRSAMEFSGFLEWLLRAGDASFELIDLTEMEILSPVEVGPPGAPWLALGLGELPADIIRYNNLLDRSRTLTPSERNEHRLLAQRLRTENAPLRVLKDGMLVSAPISFFDPVLLSLMTHDWRNMARIVGEALVAQMDERVHQAGDLLLAARIRSMVDNGLVEAQGDYFEIQKCKIRLAPLTSAGPT